jgi:hypothetical protein
VQSSFQGSVNRINSDGTCDVAYTELVGGKKCLEKQVSPDRLTCIVETPQNQDELHPQNGKELNNIEVFSLAIATTHSKGYFPRLLSCTTLH